MSDTRNDQPLGRDSDQMALDAEQADQLDARLRRDAAEWRSAAPGAEPFAARMRAALSASATSSTATSSRSNTGPMAESSVTAERRSARERGATAPRMAALGPRATVMRRSLLAAVAMAAVVALLVGLLQALGTQRGGPSGHQPTPAVPAFPTTGLVAPTPLSGTPAACNLATQWHAPDNNIALEDMAMVSPTEGWAVGAITPDPFTTPGQEPTGVIYHDTDGQWQRLPQSYPGAALSAISMGSPTDGWAVATNAVTGQGNQDLVLHYTAGAWHEVDVPALDAVLKGPAGTFGGAINQISVRMFSADAGWMFAWTNVPRDPSNPASRSAVVILRYQNGVWTSVATPTVADTTDLFRLSAISPDEAWIVGTDYGANPYTLFLHFARGQWTQYPQTFPGVTELFTMVSSTEGWAFSDSSVLHYDGTTWKPLALPSRVTALGITLTGGVFAIAPGITWFTAAYQHQFAEIGTPQELLLQYAAGQWQQIAWPYPNVFADQIVSADPGEVQAVGNIGHMRGCAPALVTGVDQGVFVRYHAGQWSETVLP